MTKKRVDLVKLKNNKKSVRFNDLIRLLKQYGWQLQSVTGSHYVYSKANKLPIMIVKPHGKHKYCHPKDVNKLIAELEAECETK